VNVRDPVAYAVVAFLPGGVTVIEILNSLLVVPLLTGHIKVAPIAVPRLTLAVVL
jgi:hypothetical protein